MLRAGLPNHFNWAVDNYTDIIGIGGTTVTADGAANTKGTNTALLVGIANDCWGMMITFSAASTDATVRRTMADILIDPAAGVGNAGSSWSVLINNLFSGNSTAGSGAGNGHMFYFPLFLSAGTAIGARCQDVVGAASCMISMKIFGKPTRPDLAHVGTLVQTIGDVAASTSGTAFTPGSTNAYGSYTASLGTLTRPSWWWQVGLGNADSSLTVGRLVVDVAHDATAKYPCIEGLALNVPTTTGEVSAKSWIGDKLPIRCAPAGTDVYVRGAHSSTPDVSNTVVVYAVT